MQTPVLIVGGGVSGLTVAFYLGRHGIRSTLLEASGRLGGLIQTDRVHGCDLEAGPDSFLATKPAVSELAADLSISDRLMGSNDQARRVLIARNGKLLPLPSGLSMMVPVRWGPVLQSPLLSPVAKTKLLREYLFKPHQRQGDFSVRELILDHFGDEALEYLTEPLLAGVYGGQSADLSAPSVLPRFVEYESTFGSLIRGAREAATKNPSQASAFLSFTGGMQTLVDSTARELSSHTDVRYERAQSIKHASGDWVIQTSAASYTTRRLVLACPAHQAADLMTTAQPAVQNLLRQIRYSSCLLLTFLFDAHSFRHPLNGFGFLVPAKERRLIAAATWINTKFPSRIAPSLVAIRAFLVDPEATDRHATPDPDLQREVLADLQRLMQISDTPLESRVYRWPHSMPQYRVGHQQLTAELEAARQRTTGLYLSSNYIDGVGIPDSIRRARLTADEVASDIKDCS